MPHDAFMRSWPRPMAHGQRPMDFCPWTISLYPTFSQANLLDCSEFNLGYKYIPQWGIWSKFVMLFVTSTNAEIALAAVERERHSDGGKIKVKHASADEVSRALHRM